jgi:tRNA(Ile)-lysidine synthase
MLGRGERVGAAVSGGADSVCLLLILLELAPLLGCEISVVHLNHQLRGAESEADAEFVRALAARLGLPFILESVDIVRSGGNLEQAGRVARRGFYRRLLETGTVRRVATGHTLSDQAETVLYRLLRGSGTAGLRGILPVTPDGVVRPLIECDRAEVESYLREKGQSWRQDSTNTELRFARNRIRHELIPMIETAYSPAVRGILAATAEVARDEEDYWSDRVRSLKAQVVARAGQAVIVDVDRLKELHPALARRLLRTAIETVKGDLRSIDIAHIERVLTLARQPEGHGRLQLPGLDIFRSFEWLKIDVPRVEPRETRDYSFALTFPTTVEMPGGRTAIRVEVIEYEGSSWSYNLEGGSILDADCLTGPLELRNWRPGDQYQRSAAGSSERIKTLFQQARVPLWERQCWPVITSGNRIIWARQFGTAAYCVPTSASRRLLRILEHEIADSSESKSPAPASHE